jgi:hypothetical protein
LHLLPRTFTLISFRTVDAGTVFIMSQLTLNQPLVLWLRLEWPLLKCQLLTRFCAKVRLYVQLLSLKISFVNLASLGVIICFLKLIEALLIVPSETFSLSCLVGHRKLLWVELYLLGRLYLVRGLTQLILMTRLRVPLVRLWIVSSAWVVLCCPSCGPKLAISGTALPLKM